MSLTSHGKVDENSHTKAALWVLALSWKETNADIFRAC